MRKVIIILKNELTVDLKEYQKLLSGYSDNNYEVNLFEDYENKIKPNDYELLRSYLDVDYFDNYDLVTDDHNLIFLWYRLYHNTFNDFILFYNQYMEPNFKELNKDEILLFSKMIKFDGISEEISSKKLFININQNNYSEVFNIFIKMLNKIEIIDSFEFRNVINESYNKIYKISNEIQYTFGNSEIAKSHVIDLTEQNFSILDHLTYDKSNENSPSMDVLAWFVYYLQSIGSSNSELINIINVIYVGNSGKQNEFIDKIFSISKYIARPFQDKINILFILLNFVEDKDEIVSQVFLFLEEDNDNIVTHNSIIISVFSAIFSKEIPNKNEYYILIRKAMLKVSTFYKERLKMPIRPNSNNQRIVITIDLLLNKMHSPTKVFIDFCNQLVSHTNFEILIIIEENLISSKEEIFGMELIRGSSSETFKETHKKLLKSDRIKLFYSNINKTKLQRIKQINNIIIEFNPTLLISYSTFSIVQNIYYNEIPIIYISFGNEYSVALADLYLYKNKLRAVEIENSTNNPNTSNIEAFINDFELLPKTKVLSRKDFKLNESDFVVLTVGNRLLTEVTEDLVEEMQKFILSNSKVKWLLVSPNIPTFIKEKYSQMLDESIIHITYESDLLALTSLCDVYLNPMRIGGGYSIAAAMQEGVPVLMTDFESDGIIIAGRENSSGSNYEDLMVELHKMYKDIKYRKSKGELFKRKMLSFGEASRLPELLDHINETLKKFHSI